MNKRDTLSIAPYYGGKGRMAHFIADRLNYDDSDIFVTPFGGMCRVLLNKPRHKVECYNDYSSGLTALMSILSNPVKSVEFIHRLDDETTYSEEEFNRQKAIFDYVENDLEKQERAKLRQLLIRKGIATHYTVNGFLDAFMEQTLDYYTGELAEDKGENMDENSDKNEDEGKKEYKYSDSVKNAFQALLAEFNEDKSFQEKFEHICENWVRLYQLKEDGVYLERTRDIGEEYISDMDLAIATYVVFQQSRDGMGKVWSAEKFKTNGQYKKQIVRLFDCAERLEGVEVFQIDAIDFFRRMMFVDVDTPVNSVPSQFQVLNEWINNSRVMMYCDPSYISVESEQKLLKDIDVDNTPCLSDAIKKKYGDKMPANLGKVYAMSFGYDDQEKFLRCIQKAKCRILVSNYDLQLYNKYLNESTGWRREEFHTTTGVGSKKDNKRTEVIWYNY